MTEQDKKSAAREFWVIPENLDLNVRTGFCLEGKPTNNGVALLCVHVIEYSAYEALKIKYDRLWDSRDLAKSDLQKRCEEKDETNQKLRFSWLEVQREKLELQAKLAEQAAEIERLGNELHDIQSVYDGIKGKIDPDTSIFDIIDQHKYLTEQNSILRPALEKECWCTLEAESKCGPCETLEKADKVKGE